ncbi:hypothetical protein AVEN_134781-1 [Araneus ventricosus]|uniref:Uncharacterized protein n=1 Tax=Araneus ventricosus TaxID=182803 RepID=A0A4Y2GC81_ARAVE|nr:hypothetical protein AVEN_134781-1 [Araneus ventricosus]
MFAAAIASAIEGLGSSCSSSVSEDEFTIELFFSFTNATISSSLISQVIMTSSSKHSKCSISFCEKAFTSRFSSHLERGRLCFPSLRPKIHYSNHNSPTVYPNSKIFVCTCAYVCELQNYHLLRNLNSLLPVNYTELLEIHLKQPPHSKMSG